MIYAKCSKCKKEMIGVIGIDYQLNGLNAECNDCFDWKTLREIEDKENVLFERY